MNHIVPIALLALAPLAGCASSNTAPAPTPALSLGNFSLSLLVKDLAASRDFYEKLGFRPIAGDARHWQILQNDSATIGLFQGGIEKNSLTFNPGWDRNSNTLAHFQDVRDLQHTLKSRGLTPTLEADPTSTDPAFFILTDPDGNPILIDQHVPKTTR